MSYLIESFLEMMALERGSAPNTLQAYERDLKELTSFLSGKGLKEATERDLESYLRKLVEKKLTAASRARKLSCLRQFYSFLLSEKIIPKSPTSLIALPKMEKKLPKFLSEDQVNLLLRTAYAWEGTEGIRLQALLELLYATGLRITELLTLSVNQVTEVFETQTLRVRGKGGKDRLVLLTEPAIMALQAYLPHREFFKKGGSSWLFPSSSQEGHLTRQRFDQLLKELSLKAGLERRSLSAHVLRHAFASHLLHRGVDLVSLQKLLGHADISTTEIYTHLLPQHLYEAVRTHHPLAQRKREEKT